MAIIIPISAPGAQQLLAVLNRMDSTIDKLNQSVQKLSQSQSRVAGSSSQAATGFQRIGNSAKQAVGPLSQLARAHQQLADAQRSGDPSRIWDAQYNYGKAQQRVARAQPNFQGSQFQKALMNAIFSTRIGFGGQNGGMNIAPLLGRMAQVVGSASGMGAGAGGAAALGAGSVMAATAALVAFTVALRAAQAHLFDMSRTMAVSGGTAGEAAMLKRMGDAFGLDGGQAARAFSDRIGQGGLDAMLARSLGINPRNSFFSGNTNDAQKYIKAIETIANMTDENLARRYAKQLDLPEAMQLRQASPDVRRRFLDQQRTMASPKAMQAAVDFQLEMAMLKQSFQDLATAMTPFIKLLSGAASVISAVIRTLQKLGLIGFGGEGSGSGSGKTSGPPKRPEITLLDILTGNAMKKLLAYLGEKYQYEHQSDTQRAATDKNTQALYDNTRAMNAFREMFGGGQRARGAIPEAWGYESLRRAQLGQLANLGAFSQ